MDSTQLEVGFKDCWETVVLVVIFVLSITHLKTIPNSFAIGRKCAPEIDRNLKTG